MELELERVRMKTWGSKHDRTIKKTNDSGGSKSLEEQTSI
jgi:hypothetical protein